VNTVMNCQVAQNVGKIMRSCATGGFSKRTQLHGVNYIQPLESEQNGLRLEKNLNYMCEVQIFHRRQCQIYFQKAQFENVSFMYSSYTQTPTETEMCGHRAC
jgi:tRNA(Leu) C34 or U34 (ribose-2'-O)-methylase TrmL